MIAKTLTVKEFLNKKSDNPLCLTQQHDLLAFKLKDKLYIKYWKSIQKWKERSNARREKRPAPNPANFNTFLWHKQHLLEKDPPKTARAEAYADLGANHLMGVHYGLKKEGRFDEAGVILPLIALNQYVFSKLNLTPERAKKAAEIAVELVETCGKYSSRWAAEQLEYVPEGLRDFLNKAAGMQGIGKELETVKEFLVKGSPELDRLKGHEAYRALLTVGGDEGIEKCRKLILEITNPQIRKEEMQKCQAYWDMYWFSDGYQPVLFSPEFTATLEKMEVLKN